MRTNSLDVGCLVESLLHAGEQDIYRKVSAAVDRVVLDAVLHFVGGNQVQASERLGISRTTLRAKLRSLGTVFEKPLAAETDAADQ